MPKTIIFWSKIFQHAAKGIEECQLENYEEDAWDAACSKPTLQSPEIQLTLDVDFKIDVFLFCFIIVQIYFTTFLISMIANNHFDLITNYSYQRAGAQYVCQIGQEWL